jgi:hypothetical protein
MPVLRRPCTCAGYPRLT